MGKEKTDDRFPPPRTYTQFVTRYPTLDKAWSLLGDAGREGPLDEKTLRLVKLALAMGSMSGGQTRSGVRKALNAGVTREEIEQLVALGAGTLGLPSAAAIYTWVSEILNQPDRPRNDCC